MPQDDLPEGMVRRIADYLLIDHTAVRPADLCLVFGNRFVCRELAAKAAELYHRGLAKKIVASGGVLTPEGVTEASAIRDELLRLGVPEGDILVEDKSAHTGENVAFTKDLVEKTLGAGAVRSVIGVGHISAGRRFLMTLAKQWPEVLAMQVSVNPYPVAREDWPRHEAFREKVLEEWAKIAGYQEQGFIAEIDIDAINRNVQGGPAPAP